MCVRSGHHVIYWFVSITVLRWCPIAGRHGRQPQRNPRRSESWASLNFRCPGRSSQLDRRGPHWKWTRHVSTAVLDLVWTQSNGQFSHRTSDDVQYNCTPTRVILLSYRTRQTRAHSPFQSLYINLSFLLRWTHSVTRIAQLNHIDFCLILRTQLCYYSVITDKNDKRRSKRSLKIKSGFEHTDYL